MLAAEELSSGWFLENAWLIAVVPAIAFGLIIFFGRRSPAKGAGLGIASMAVSTVLATGAVAQWVQRTNSAEEGGEELGLMATFGRSVPRLAEGGEAEPFIEPVITSWTWWQSGGLEFSIGSFSDGLSVVLMWLVAFISLLVQIFSVGYLKGDRRYTHFFAALTLFSAGMLVMVMAQNMVQLILGWEIMGLCSFMLIGHWWEEEANSRAALKAFFTVRVGDVGLLVGTAIIFFGANGWAQDNLGSNGFEIDAIQAWALSGEGSDRLLFWGAVALFIAAIGKSGQFPLHTWLPDAMAGPTPVSSLLHSSTMVVAGVFLVARIYPVFWEGFNIGTGGLSFIAIIGGITIVIAAVLAFVQDDIKKVLAYSTVSQLGYMMLGLGTGAWLAAVFHIFTHAFFKCCLFLCAGSISHSASHHSFDMKKDMGGLWRVMPITFAAWIVSTLALTGVFPFAGFWSKDEIIDNVGDAGYDFFMWTGLGGAALTAMYMTRATYLTFFGEARGAAAGHPHHDDEEYQEEHEMEHIGVGAPMSLSAAANAGDDAVGGGTGPGDGDHAHGGADDHDADDHEAAHDATHDDAAHDAAGHDDAAHDGHGGDHGDHHDDHHGEPHESGLLLLVPIVILAFGALFAGFANPTPLGEEFENMKKYVEPRPEEVVIEDYLIATGPGEQVGLFEPRADEAEDGKKVGCGRTEPAPGTVCFFPAVSHAVPTLQKILISLGVVAAGFAIAIPFNIAFYGRRNPRLVGLTQRSRILRVGYDFLANKYYLDWLYENVIVRFIAHPFAKANYWFNQHVIDGVVNWSGRETRKGGEWVYRNVDQRVVDGAVNATGTAASETGHGLQPTQSGFVNTYGALLFGAAAVGAIVLVIVTVG